MKNYIELTEENYKNAIRKGLRPMSWIKDQLFVNSSLLKQSYKVITYDGSILDIRKELNAIEEGYTKVTTIEDLVS